MNVIASTIFTQLGGNRFAAMVGMSTGTHGADSLAIRFKAKGRDGINAVRVTLDASDTYTVKYFKIRGANVAEIREESGIYADMLRASFEDATGLATSL